MSITRSEESLRQGGTHNVVREMLSAKANPALPAIHIIDDAQPVTEYPIVVEQKKLPVPSVAKRKSNRPRHQPVENIELHLSAADLQKINETKSFHTVLKINIDGVLHFVKLNVEDSPMSPMEAGISEINRFFIDDLAAPSRAVYKMIDGKPVYFGVASRAFTDFKSLIDDPLKPDDLRIGYLDEITNEINRLQKVIVEATKAKHLRLDDLKQAEKDLAIKEQELKRRVQELDRVDEEFTDQGRDINKLDRGSNKKIRGRIPVDDLIKYHKLKTLTTIIEWDHFIEEDDGHRGNIGNRNFDDDCKLWKITVFFKEAKTMVGDLIQRIDWTFRKPNANTFRVTTKDLENSPDLTDESRFIWCTKTDPYPAVIENMRSIFKRILSLSQNAYSRDEINLFKSLKDHTVYQFHKNKMYLRMILPDDKIFANLLKLHMKPNLVTDKLEKKGSILEAMNDEIVERQRDFKDKLIPSQQFKKFIEDHGEYAMKWIEGKYAKYNKRIQDKIDLHKDDEEPGYTQKLLVDLKNLRAKYTDLCKQIKEYSLLKIIPIPEEEFQSNSPKPRARFLRT